MMVLDKVRTKLEEYGLQIFAEYPVEDSEYVFYVEDMMLFVGTKDNIIGVSFQATLKPDKTANIMLILNELKLEVDVMESFIYDRNNRCVTGNKAFELIENAKQSTIIQDFLKEQTLHEILLTAKCYDC
jgi:hypothetical protein